MSCPPSSGKRVDDPRRRAAHSGVEQREQSVGPPPMIVMSVRSWVVMRWKNKRIGPRERNPFGGATFRA